MSKKKKFRKLKTGSYIALSLGSSKPFEHTIDGILRKITHDWVVIDIDDVGCDMWIAREKITAMWDDSDVYEEIDLE